MEEHSLNSFKGSLFYLKIIACIIMQMNHSLYLYILKKFLRRKVKGLNNIYFGCNPNSKHFFYLIITKSSVGSPGLRCGYLTRFSKPDRVTITRYHGLMSYFMQHRLTRSVPAIPDELQAYAGLYRYKLLLRYAFIEHQPFFASTLTSKRGVCQRVVFPHTQTKARTS